MLSVLAASPSLLRCSNRVGSGWRFRPLKSCSKLVFLGAVLAASPSLHASMLKPGCSGWRFRPLQSCSKLVFLGAASDQKSSLVGVVNVGDLGQTAALFACVAGRLDPCSVGAGAEVHGPSGLLPPRQPLNPPEDKHKGSAPRYMGPRDCFLPVSH